MKCRRLKHNEELLVRIAILSPFDVVECMQLKMNREERDQDVAKVLQLQLRDLMALH